MIVDAVESADAAELDADVDAQMFALEFAALLDGLSIQVALEDPEVDSDGGLRHRDAVRRAGTQPARRAEAARPRAVKKTLSAPRSSATGIGDHRRRAAVQHPHRVVGADAVDPLPRAGGRPNAGPAWLGTSTISARGRADVDVHLGAVPEVDHLRHDAGDDVVPVADRLVGVLQR